MSRHSKQLRRELLTALGPTDEALWRLGEAALHLCMAPKSVEPLNRSGIFIQRWHCGREMNSALFVLPAFRRDEDGVGHIDTRFAYLGGRLVLYLPWSPSIVRWAWKLAGKPSLFSIFQEEWEVWL